MAKRRKVKRRVSRRTTRTARRTTRTARRTTSTTKLTKEEKYAAVFIFVVFLGLMYFFLF